MSATSNSSRPGLQVEYLEDRITPSPAGDLDPLPRGAEARGRRALVELVGERIWFPEPV